MASPQINDDLHGGGHTGQDAIPTPNQVDDSWSFAEPFSLLESKGALLEISSQLHSKFQIVDAYPTTPLQQGLVALSMKQDEGFFVEMVYRLPANINMERFKTAWQVCANKNTTLRTVFIQTKNLGLAQVVVEPEEIEWQTSTNLKQHLANDRAIYPELGSRLVRYSIVNEPESRSTHFVWTFHHALIDGWTINLLLDQVDEIYRDGTCISLHNFNRYMKYFVQREKLSSKASEEFWVQHLRDPKSRVFPPLPSERPVGASRANSSVSRDISIPKNIISATASTVIQAAWALLVARYSDAEEATFGLVLAGRNLDLPGIKRVSGPTFTTVPMRVNLQDERTLAQLLQSIHEVRTVMKPHQHVGLQNIQRFSPDALRSCNFENVLVIQPMQHRKPDSLFVNAEDMAQQQARFNAHALLMECRLTHDGFVATAVFDSKRISKCDVDKLLEELQDIVLKFAEGMNTPLKEIQLLKGMTNDEDISMPIVAPGFGKVESCVHDVILRASQSRMCQEAIVSWDGRMTHRELHHISDRLAHRLRRSNVGPEIMVALMFEKSLWAVVAIMAVMKAGGVFVSLDPTHPEMRLRDLIQQTGAQLLLCSDSLAAKFSPIAKETIPVSSSTMQGMVDTEGIRDDTVIPNNACYVLFTSGSSGTPKGCIIEHATCSSTSRALSSALGMDSSTRMLQLSSYTFDACIFEILTTLSVGGCICIPSEHEKMNDITTAINRLEANTSCMTPSFARLVFPSAVPSLKLLVLGGEQLVADDLDRWFGKLRLFEAYGPTEGCVICLVNEIKSRGVNPAHLGRPIIGSCTVVATDMRRVPDGIIGELVIAGPHLARGYLNDPTKTAAAFVPLKSMSTQKEPIFERWYKTGDLVRWDTDASCFEYVKRKDTQIKLNGQRIETGEIESHLRQHIPNLVDVAVVVANPKDGKPFLAAFIFQSTPAGLIEDLTDNYCSSKLLGRTPLDSPTIQKIVDELHQLLPSYMVPKVYIPLNQMPLTSSGKNNRKILEEFATGLNPLDRVAYSGEQADFSAPRTAKELIMQQLWAKILHVPSSSIGRHDHFMRLGGDSILAMKLVAEAREVGLGLSVATVFRSSTLAGLVTQTFELSSGNSGEQGRTIPPFSLAGDGAMVKSILKEATSCYTNSEKISDVYPCTPFQRGIITLSACRPGTYVAQHVFELPKKVAENIDIFRSAWDTVVAATPVLRTKILQTEASGLMQVVTENMIVWKTHNDLEEFLKMDRSIPLGIGMTLNRHAIVKCSSGRVYFVWTMHHACYDGWSLRLTLQDVEQEYFRRISGDSEDRSNPRPFNLFVETVQKLDIIEAKRFWEAKLSHGEPATFPTITPGYVPHPNAILEGKLHFTRKQGSDFRTSSLVRAAWLITISTYADADDIVFGATLSGRTGSAFGLAAIVGPTISTVPVRAQLDRQMSVVDFLRIVEAAELDAMPFEQLGLSEIRVIDDRVKAACDFQNLLVIQPLVDSDIDSFFLGPRVTKLLNADVFDTYALTMECLLEKDGMRTNAIYDPNVIPESQMQRVIRHFEHIIGQLCNESASNSILEINTINPQDAKEIQTWNADVPAPMNACVHHLVEDSMLQNPNATAICSWDGELTRGELHSIVTRLAQHLSDRGVGIGSRVPVLFNKSKWAVAAILSVIKAGGVFVPLDPRNPVQRHISVVKQIGAKVILCSNELRSLCSVSFPPLETIVIDAATVTRLPDRRAFFSRDLNPQNDLYIIFTSGSTGEPKGTVIQHGAYCAGARDHAKALYFDEKTRFLQFASYSFDTSVEDILTTLITGGCLCIPSEEERSSDIIGAISRMNVNTADLTPSIISSISPDDVPSLRRLILGGEPMTTKAIVTWADRVHLINAYGTTECCVTSLVNASISASTSPSNIGHAVGAVCWIVDPADSTRLLPIGAIGELLIEGPAIASGYLDDSNKSVQYFQDSLKFNSHQVRTAGRHYKTGDLVQYNPDGSMGYVGRKDTRIKLHGQRVELGDIEHHLSTHPDVRTVLAVLPSSGPYKGTITALVEFDRLLYAGKKQDVKIVPSSELQAAGLSWRVLADHMKERVPLYMVPSSWIAVERMPIHTSGKLDRTKLNTWIYNLPANHRTMHELEKEKASLIEVSDAIAMDISERVAAFFPAKIPGRKDMVAGRDLKLADAGIDSIRMMTFAAGLKRRYGVAVPMSVLVSHDTKISDIASHIRRFNEGQAAVDDTSVDLLTEFRLFDTQLEALQCPIGVVFLTGATGYLGLQILRQLLILPSVCKVIVHVRALSLKDAMRRLESAAKSAKWSMVDYVSKVEIWTGDLGKSSLGLTPAQWQNLQDVDAIIHNGASVKWTSDYHSLKAANVHSTVDLLKAVHSSSKRMKLVYITGGRSFDDQEELQLTLTKLSSLDGYSQTKFLAEALVKTFAQREANMGRFSHISIVEPGLIMGTAQEGIANTSDFVWRYVVSALRIGMYPMPDEEDWLEISSSDRVARAAIDGLLRMPPSPGAKTKMTDGIGMQDFWDVVTAHAGRHIQPVSSEDWKKRIDEDLNQETEAHPLWPVAHLLAAEGNLGKSMRKSENGVGRRDDKELMETLQKNVASLVQGEILRIGDDDSHWKLSAERKSDR